MGARQRMPLELLPVLTLREDTWSAAMGARQRMPWDKAVLAHEGHLEVLQWARANGCPWNSIDLCFALRKEDTWRCCNGRAPTDALGMNGPVLTLREEDTWRCCNGRAPTDALGINGPVLTLRKEDTWRCCNGHAPTDVLELYKISDKNKNKSKVKAVAYISPDPESLSL